MVTSMAYAGTTPVQSVTRRIGGSVPVGIGFTWLSRGLMQAGLGWFSA